MSAKKTVKNKGSKVKSRISRIRKSGGARFAARGESRDNAVTILGNISGDRVPSRILEERIQSAVQEGARELHVVAQGQHGIGGRIWPRGETVKITVEGPVGQRLGSMGMTGTEIIVKGSASDDIGWLNCGAKITVLGDVTNGAFNAAAQGILYIQESGKCSRLPSVRRNGRRDHLFPRTDPGIQRKRRKAARHYPAGLGMAQDKHETVP
jgi:formylmethanofuran dehydrogenase subunit C